MADSTQTQSAVCSRCGATLVRAALQGLCPRCVAALALAPALDPPPEFPASLATLRYFGDYELIEEIARGGMGAVYRARQVNLNREVAVKLMLHGALASAEDVQRFRAEATAAASLKHPNIIAIHEVGEHEGQHYFSMDLVVGRNLDELTRIRPLEARPAATLLARIAKAVHYAHGQGVLHRDLKPSNVLVDAAGEPHVTDFGLARRISGAETLTQTGQLLGTPGFMAPEQAAGNSRELGAAADIYSLGAVLYQLLTARAPFTGASLLDVLQQVIHSDPVAPRLLNPAVPRDLETICLKCLRKYPSHRYATALELAEDLGRFLRREPIRARPINAVERLARWCRRNPAVAGLLATVGVLLVVVAVGSAVAARRKHLERLVETRLRLEAEQRQRQGERLISFMLGDLTDRLEPLGKLDVLDSTFAEVEKFYTEVPVDRMTPESERNRAHALFQFADVRASQGRFAEALTNFHSAIAGYEKLLAAHRTNLQWQFELSRTRNSLGITYARQNDFTNAAAVLTTALRERERLVEMRPTNIYWLTSLAATAQNLGQVSRRLGRLEEAAALLRRAERAFRQWVALEPEATLPKERLATACGSIGQRFAASGELTEAAKYYREKVEILEGLLRTDAKMPRWRADLVLGLGYLGELELNQTNATAAVATLTRSTTEADQLVSYDSANREWQLALMVQLAQLGKALRAAGRPPEALAAYRRVWEFSSRQADAARGFPDWFDAWKRSLAAGVELHRTFAESERTAGHEESAIQHERLASTLEQQQLALEE